jgi:hypothetical protein
MYRNFPVESAGGGGGGVKPHFGLYERITYGKEWKGGEESSLYILYIYIYIICRDVCLNTAVVGYDALEQSGSCSACQEAPCSYRKVHCYTLS